MKTEIKVLVTGGSGFIGTNVVDFYTKKGFSVLNLDVTPPKIQAHNSFWRNINILNLDALSKIVHDFNPTHVIHLAARTDLDEEKNLDGYAANMQGVENMIYALKDCKELVRVIFTSSMYVCYPGYNPVNYEDYSPHTLYGKSKMLSEKIVKDSSTINFDWVIIRPTSIWGPWFGYPYKNFFYHVRKRTYLKMNGKTTTKTYGFIFNSIYQIDCLLFSDSELINKKTFYIGDSPGLNINDWADEISHQLNVRLFNVPRFVLFLGAWFGDFLSLFKLNFPLQSFRIKNMTTDNVIDLLDDTLKVAPESPYDTQQGVSITLNWLKSNDPNF